jgi:hypothetical protein
MASAKKRSAAPALDEARVEAELSASRRRLVDEGGVKLSSLKPKALAERLIPALVAEGFEVSGSWLRRPLGVQLEQALAHGAALARKSLAAQVRGATAAELQRALAAAEGAGTLQRILRGKAELWVGSSAAVVSGAALLRLRAAVSALDKALAQAVRKKGVALLASDVQQALDEVAQLAPQPPASRAQGGESATVKQPLERERTAIGAAQPERDGNGREERALRSVVAAVGASRDEHTGLAFVPDIVRRLLPAMPAAVALDMLLLAASQELVELRPEGGLGRLAPGDLELCPPGPAQTRLSYARLLAGARP